MSGFGFVDDSDSRESLFMAWVEEKMADRRRARNRFPAEEVEALLESLKTDSSFTKPVKWGK